MTIERVAIKDVKPNPDNPRIIKDDKFAKLVQSIKDFPQMLELRPIIVNADLTVLGGNMRLKACQAAGLTEVPVVRADALTPEQQREFIIKDNVGFGEWDWDELANTWDADQLSEWGLDTEWNADKAELPEIADIEKKALECITFTLTTEQADTIREAMELATTQGPFGPTGNDNRNGNALARVAEVALGAFR